jgi:tetratricopeptide (TPR) repeat protein
MSYLEPLSLDDINRGLTAHQAGLLVEAEEIYLKLIESSPNNVDVLHLLGALYHQIGKNLLAEKLLDSALKLEPNFPEALNARGILNKNVGRLVEAERDFQAAIFYKPDFPQALTNLADIYRLNMNLTEAKKLIRKAIKLAPKLAPAYNNLGAIERDLNNNKEASKAFQKAIEIDENLFEAQINIAIALNQLGHRDKAFAAARHGVEKAPNYAPAHNCLGSLFFNHGQIENARSCFIAACSFDSTYADAHNNLANTLVQLNKFEDAEAYYDIAITLEPMNPDFWANKASMFLAENKMEKAFDACEQALNISPEHVDAKWNRAITRLICGDLSGGFADYEVRWALPEFKSRKFDSQLWTGENLYNRSIILYSEQGLGDTIQFVRYVALVNAAKPKAIYLVTQKSLVSLLSKISDINQVFNFGEALPKTDYYIPLMGLAHVFETTLETIPQGVPYLSMSREMFYDFEVKVNEKIKLKVGLNWAGRPSNKNDRNRSISLEMLGPITKNNKVQFYSLQYGEEGKVLNPSINNIINLSEKLGDFAQTATIIKQLDLIITVDTALAHLAGALGVKCWVMLPFAPDWRWMLESNETPWYPSIKLFRQAKPGDWQSVIDLLVADLAEFEHSMRASN